MGSGYKRFQKHPSKLTGRIQRLTKQGKKPNNCDLTFPLMFEHFSSEALERYHTYFYMFFTVFQTNVTKYFFHSFPGLS